MENYEELEGKIIDYSDNSIIYKGKVIGCDPDIGITIINLNDPNNYLLCLIGPSSSLWDNSFDLKLNKKTFKVIVNQIKNGKINIPAINKARKNNYTPPATASAATCPFGQ